MGLKDDGLFGPNTHANINAADSEVLFGRLKASREAFVRAIAANNRLQERFLKGWLNRIHSFKFND